MQLIAITEVSVAGIGYQWFEKEGFLKRASVRHIGMIRWKDIERASVFKRDLFTYDLICLELALGTGDVFELDDFDIVCFSFLD